MDQTIKKTKTISANSKDSISIPIPSDKVVLLKGYGYSYTAGSTYQLDTGNALLPKRTDQEGSIIQPRIFAGEGYPCRSGGSLQLIIENTTSLAITYTASFYVISNTVLAGPDYTSDGTDLNTDSGTPYGFQQLGANQTIPTMSGTAVINNGAYQTIYSVPAGKTLMVTDVEIHSGTTAAQCNITDDTTQKFFVFSRVGDIQYEHFQTPFQFTTALKILSTSTQTYNWTFNGYLY